MIRSSSCNPLPFARRRVRRSVTLAEEQTLTNAPANAYFPPPCKGDLGFNAIGPELPFTHLAASDRNEHDTDDKRCLTVGFQVNDLAGSDPSTLPMRVLQRVGPAS
jgi:hypothetical protein